MNTNNCTPGWATDDGLLPFAENSCDTPLVAFSIPACFLLGLRSILTLFLWQKWFERKRHMRDNQGSSIRARLQVESRLPVVPFLSSCITATWILFFLLIGFNVANVDSGIVPIFLSWTFAIWASFTLLFVNKLVHMGNKFAMWEMSVTKNDSNRRFDCFLRSLLAFEISCIIAQLVLANIFCVMFPRSLSYLQAMYAIQGGFISLVDLSVVYQLERSVRVIKKAAQSDFLREAVRRLRQQQAFFIVLWTFVLGMHSLLASLILELRSFTALYYLFIEFSSSGFAAFAASRRSKRRNNQLVVGEVATSKETRATAGGGGATVAHVDPESDKPNFPKMD